MLDDLVKVDACGIPCYPECAAHLGSECDCSAFEHRCYLTLIGFLIRTSYFVSIAGLTGLIVWLAW